MIERIKSWFVRDEHGDCQPSSSVLLKNFQSEVKQLESHLRELRKDYEQAQRLLREYKVDFRKLKQANANLKWQLKKYKKHDKA